jgi:hypothetical protein
VLTRFNGLTKSRCLKCRASLSWPRAYSACPSSSHVTGQWATFQPIAILQLMHICCQRKKAPTFLDGTNRPLRLVLLPSCLVDSCSACTHILDPVTSEAVAAATPSLKRILACPAPVAPLGLAMETHDPATSYFVWVKQAKGARMKGSSVACTTLPDDAALLCRPHLHIPTSGDRHQ